MDPSAQMLQAAHRLVYAGKPREAEMYYRKILLRNPNHAEALNALGVVLSDLKKFGDALRCLGRAAQLMPNAPEPYSNIGRSLELQGKHEEAIAMYDAAIAVDTKYVEAYFNRGNAFKAVKKAAEAEASYRRALELDPGHAGTLRNFSNLLCAQSKDAEARIILEQRLERKPGDADALALLAQVSYRQNRLDESKRHAQRALEANPRHPLAIQQMALIGWANGDAEAAVEWGRRCIEVAPGWDAAHSHLLFSMNYAFSVSTAEAFEEHVRWGRRFTDPLTGCAAPHRNDADPERRLRIGYVSGDFRTHVVSVYFLPVLEAHDRSQVEVFCYCNSPSRDTMTRRLQDRAGQWRDITEMSDDDAATLIREDGIDVLIDLGGHTGYNRLGVFARKPAPVQITWLGYVSTTGMKAMDYRIADFHITPPGESDALFVEKLIRFPVVSCYLPPDYCPTVGALPARRNGFITFGSSNNPGKISGEALAAWCGILNRTPGSILQLNFPSWSNPGTRRKFLDCAVVHGIGPERVRLLHTSHAGNLASYNDVDIALDPFPFNGSTTTLEALWMGVPVLAIEGSRYVSRMSMATLKLMDMPECIARSAEDYVALGVEMAQDLDRLERWRSQLRQRMACSPLTDIAAFTRGLERAYHQAWRRWCGERGGPGAPQEILKHSLAETI